MATMIYDIGNLQGPGRRDYQQDAFAISNASDESVTTHGLDLVLADGMGGISDGGTIAQATVEYLRDTLEQASSDPDWEAVIGAISAVNAEIYTYYKESGGTTLIVAHLDDDRLWFASVGDSNIFLLRADQLFELNRRHEFMLDLFERVLEGSLTVPEAIADPQAKALSSFIGCKELKIDSSEAPLTLEADDALMLCSDGISDTLNLEQIRQAMKLALEANAQAVCEQLEQLIDEAALPNQDNYTAIVVRYRPAVSAANSGEEVSFERSAKLAPQSDPGATGETSEPSTVPTTHPDDEDEQDNSDKTTKEEQDATEKDITADDDPGDRVGGFGRRLFGFWRRSGR
jgi:protein phosphatase